MLADSIIIPVLPASDMERAKKFYAEKLGLVPAMEIEGGIAYKVRDSWFLLYPTRFAGTAEHTIASWLVDDLAETVAELRSRGVVFEEYDEPDLKTVNGIADTGDYRGAWFKDSEGNIIALGQLPDDFWSML